MSYGQVMLGWAPNPEADLAGYNIYWGLAPNVLSLLQNAGMTATPSTPSVLLTSFTNYGTLYFAVTAYDSSQNESGLSGVVTKGVAPVLMPMVWG